MTVKELKIYLINHDMSQRDLAREAGVSERTVRRWLTGETKLPKWLDKLLSK